MISLSGLVFTCSCKAISDALTTDASVSVLKTASHLQVSAILKDGRIATVKFTEAKESH